MGGLGQYPDWYDGPKPSAGFNLPTPKYGPMVGMLIRPATGPDCSAYQDIHSPEKLLNVSLNLFGWVCATGASTTRIAVNDGVSTTYSSYHTGSGAWEKLEATHTVSKSATMVRIELSLSGSSAMPAFFDTIKLEGTAPTYGYTRKTVYDIISDIVGAIGGTLSYESLSSEITTLYPRLEVTAGRTGLEVLDQLLQLVPDKIKWFGNDAVLYYPRTTDSPIYYYKGPE